MLALLCDCCSAIFITEKDTRNCERCTDMIEMSSQREYLLEYVEFQLAESRKFIMEFIGNAEMDSAYHYHLGQAAAMQDLKNLLFVQSV